jgi:uncharacterized protein YggT (Ycf19 family)
MAEIVERRRGYHRGDVADEPDVVAVDRRPNVLARVIYFIMAVVLIILAFRFLLSLLGANQSNAFANFIYNVSHPFVAPFFNLFNYNNIVYGTSRFEIYTLFAMLVYAVIGWALAYLATIGDRRRDAV